MASSMSILVWSQLLLVVTSVEASRVVGVAGNLSSPCDRHLKMYEDSLYTQLWAMQMFDATTKIPTGLLYGTPIDMGNYDECVQINVETPDGDEFGGKHCLVDTSPAGQRVGSKSVLETLAMAVREQKNVNTQMNVGNQIPNIGGYYGTIGVCLPSSCTAVDFEMYLNNNPYSLLPGTIFSATESNCSDGKKDPFRPIDWFAIAFLITFGLLALGSTTYDLMTAKSGSRNELFLAFSWYTNGKKLFSTRKSAMDLSCLHGIRFFSMLWVVLGHRYSLNISLPSTNQSEMVNQYISNWGYMYLQSGGLSVDSFFLLSGILVSYMFLNGVHKGAKFNIFLYYLHRYIRLTPALLVIILMYVSLVKYMGTGPYYEKNWPTKCDESWWKNILYINNYIDNLCVGQAWYLAADMQLYWLSPLVLIPLWKKPAIGEILIGVFTLTGLAITFGICYHFKVASHMEAIVNGGDDGLNFGGYYYNYTHTRFTPWLVGIAFGYILHKIKRLPVGTFKMTLIQWLGVWALAAFFMLITLCGPFGMNQLDHEFNLLETTFYNTFHRPVWALGLGLMIFACCTGYGGPVDTFLSWSFFMPLSRLTYSIFLLHFAMQLIISQTIRNKSYNTDINMLADIFGDIVFTTLVAIVISLLFESPFLVLEKLLLGGKNKKITPLPEKSKVEPDPESPLTVSDLPPMSNGSNTKDRTE